MAFFSRFFDGLVGLATRVGVGVERTAFGGDDNPLVEITEEIGDRFGPPAAEAVEKSVDTLIDTLGTDLLADVEPTTLPPDFDVNNGLSDTAHFEVPDGPYILDIGNPENVGDGELARIILGALDGDGDDSDAEQILAELLTGESGATLDSETEPGIEGVTLTEITSDSYTIEIEDGDAIDTLTLKGPGVEAAIANLNAAPTHSAPAAISTTLVENHGEDLPGDPLSGLFDFKSDLVENIHELLDSAYPGDDHGATSEPYSDVHETLSLFGSQIETALSNLVDEAQDFFA